MSNVVKFERPPEPKTPKPKRSLSVMQRRFLIWFCLAAAFFAVWAGFSLFGV